MDEPGQIGRRVQRMRVERGLTQKQLAHPSYTSAYVSTLESGKVRPSETALRFLAARLGTSYEELATGRPAHLATELRLALTDAQRTLATGAADEAAVRYRRLLAEAEELGLAPEQAQARLGLGECALESGELPAAIGHFEEAERLLADEPLPLRARPVRGRAVAHLLAGELRYACYLLESAIDELGASGLADPDALVLLHAAVIGPYMDMGAHARAAHSAEIALALAPQVGDPALVAGMHRQVARTFLAEGRMAEADASLAKAQAIYGRLQLSTDLAHCHWMRGYVLAQNGELEPAERELRTARDMLSARRAGLYTAQVEVELADVLRRLGRQDEAAGLLAALLDLGNSHGAVHAGGAHRLLGLMAEERGESESAEEHYVQALALLERSGATGDLADLCRLLGDLLRRTGRVEAAMDAYRTGLGHRAAPGTTTLGPAPAGAFRPARVSGSRWDADRAE
ncbi:MULTISPECIES: helix-turn-helix domain-containing protein [Streptomyces]|uniref:helix-turn-helix domain-containing protein n=1 Tax=Streptomyces TaxID=1883 RepID=UPI0005F97ADB|nr:MULTISPECIES: helix-turn-helix domain-containing protein [Streptomyces]KJY19380.1 DNA-binding protein [Streptomyces sp. NRRL S-104]KOU33477.1 DNA-binding protein [Streptomyces sp. WM6373]KOU74082.1 DNA-binding protein [Streptomyces sp. IGB124]KOU76878.1 DNA-binding protein [Streptomyces sp. XY66]KOU86429.1 DNA-binding protein [Streptomyces sp. XY58]